VSRPPAAAAFTAWDVTVGGLAAVAGLLREVGAEVGRLAGGVEVMLAVGASLFARRFGLAGRAPVRLAAMTAFPNDALDPAWCHGDLLVQVCAADPAAARAALGRVAGAAGNRVRERWRIEGFRGENTLTAGGRPNMRDLLGFREGIGNPDPHQDGLMEDLVWVRAGGGEPAWAVGGSYQAVRLIRFATQVWDAEPLTSQEAAIGRRRSDGAPLGHDREDALFDYRDDPTGRVIPLDAHIRRANPRTPRTQANRILRRGYSYQRGPDAAGRPDQGLIFVCFQQDLRRGFITVQKRLAGEALSRYVLPFGGGYFFVLPGHSGQPADYLGRTLIDAAR
jgi:deferrochelatase/peroxidase EfeB